MLPDKFFHPNHVVPTIELAATKMKMCHPLVAHSFMKTNTLMGEVFIFVFYVGDTSIQIENALFLESGFQSIMEFHTNTLML